MSIFRVIDKLNDLSEVEELVHVLYDVNRSRKGGTMDAVSGIRMRKSIIDDFVKKKEEDTRQCIETEKDLFLLWLYDKVSVYKNSDDNAVSSRTANATINEVCTSIADSVGSTDDEEEKVKVGKQNAIRTTTNDRKGQFTHHLTEFDVTTRIQSFANAVTAFTERFHCVRGKYGLKTRDRVRDVRSNEKAASYYCLCGTRDAVYFQFRHHQVTDVISSINNKKYLFRCFVKPQFAVIVESHFQPFLTEPFEYQVPISSITKVEVKRDINVNTKRASFMHVEPSILTPVTAATNTVVSVGNRLGQLKFNSGGGRNKKRQIEQDDNVDDVCQSIIGQNDNENKNEKDKTTNTELDPFDERIKNVESLLISKGLLGEKPRNSFSEIVVGNVTKRTRRDIINFDARNSVTRAMISDTPLNIHIASVDDDDKADSMHNSGTIVRAEYDMSLKDSVQVPDESNDSDGYFSEENDDATREAFLKKFPKQVTG